MSPLEENQTSQILPWENFSNWVHAICIVTFDLELGQAMELIYPCHRELSERERANICYLAFPDSNSGLMGNVQFHFRIRLCPNLNSNSRFSSSLIQQYNNLCPVALKGELGYMYGYVYFRQVKDKSLKRGYFQKSVVLLSRLPLVAFFTQVMGIIAPEYFDTGEASLEAACHDIDQWPPPNPGHPLSLPLHGTLIKMRIASHQDKIGHNGKGNSTKAEPASMSPALIIPNPHEMPAFPIMAPVLPYLNLLWELVLVAEPIVVMATNPTTAANMVQTLIRDLAKMDDPQGLSLISPMKYSGDFRPFFTIHDSEFKEYTTRTSAPPNIILGVTNPFFAKTLQHWPHVIRLGEDDGVHKAKLSKMRTLKVVEQKPGVYTKFKAHLQADKGLVKRLLKGVQMGRPLEVQSALLRRHLLELTQSFIIPLERYAAQLMPFQKNVCPFKSIPTLRTFNPEEFLGTLDTSGPQLTSGVKGDWEGLYRRFFKSVNFSSWFELRYREMSRKLSALHVHAMSEADMKEWVSSRCEVEVVDMFLRFRSKLEIASDLQIPKSTVDKLNLQVDFLLGTLPEDLRSVLQRT